VQTPNMPKAPVVPGSLPQEKADNVPIMASQGEYMLPAEVVRWHGMKAINSLMADAQKGLADLQAQGQIKSHPPQKPYGQPAPGAQPQPQPRPPQGQPRPPQGQPKPPMSPQQPQGQQKPANPVTGMAQGGMVMGNPALPQGVTIQQRITPDGRLVHVYVDAQGNELGQPGSKTIGGGTAGGFEYKNTLDKETKKPVVEAKTAQNTVDTYEHGHGDGGAKGGGESEGVSSNGPPGKEEVGYETFGDFVDAAKEQLGNVADQVSKDLAQAASNFGRDIGVDKTTATTDTSSTATGPDHGETDGPGTASDGGSSAGGNSGGDQGTAGDGAGGTGAGSSGSGGGMGASGGVGGTGTEGATAYADGGFVAPPGLNMRALPPTKGTSAPWLR
jgi:hypothetical protein